MAARSVKLGVISQPCRQPTKNEGENNEKGEKKPDKEADKAAARLLFRCFGISHCDITPGPP